MADEVVSAGMDVEELQRCRCAECETERKRGCNSSRLRELLGNLFEADLPVETTPGLYCRHKSKGASRSGEEEIECLCDECELATGEHGYFCLEKETP